MADKKDKYTDYVPEIMEYDTKIDGGQEHMIRDEHLAQKESLIDVISKMKAKQRGPNKERR